MEDCHPQVTLQSKWKKYASIKQGDEVQTVAQKIDVEELFQLEIRPGKKWAFRSMRGTFWRIDNAGSVISDADAKGAEAFEVKWFGPAMALKAANGNWVQGHGSGAMYAVASEPNEDCKFFFQFVNRPQIVLRSPYGFVGLKESNSRLIPNKPEPHVFECQYLQQGGYKLKAPNGNMVKVTHTGDIEAVDNEAEEFYFELLENTQLSMKAKSSGLYLSAEQKGDMICKSTDNRGKDFLFEY